MKVYIVFHDFSAEEDFGGYQHHTEFVDVFSTKETAENFVKELYANRPEDDYYQSNHDWSVHERDVKETYGTVPSKTST